MTLIRKDFPQLSDEQYRILGRVYCREIAIRGDCTTTCTNCQTNLAEVFYELSHFENPKNPAAIFTWLLHEKLAEISEQQEAPKSSPKNWLGEMIVGNPFEMFLEKMK